LIWNDERLRGKSFLTPLNAQERERERDREKENKRASRLEGR
jgi:hypothetical protein